MVAGSVGCPWIARELIEAGNALTEVIDGDPLAPLDLADWTGAAPGKLSMAVRARLRSLLVRFLTASDRPWPRRLALALMLLDEVGRIAAEDPKTLNDLLLAHEAALEKAPMAELVQLFPEHPERFCASSRSSRGPCWPQANACASGNSTLLAALRALGGDHPSPEGGVAAWRAVLAPALRRRRQNVRICAAI